MGFLKPNEAPSIPCLTTRNSSHEPEEVSSETCCHHVPHGSSWLSHGSVSPSSQRSSRNTPEHTILPAGSFPSLQDRPSTKCTCKEVEEEETSLRLSFPTYPLRLSIHNTCLFSRFSPCFAYLWLALVMTLKPDAEDEYICDQNTVDG